MSARYDVVVIGAGHNGLTAAAFLAKAGRKVLVMEARETLGGLAAAEEFHPGYRSGGLMHETGALRRVVVRELELERHGLRLRTVRPDLLALGADGAQLMLAGDSQRAAVEIGNAEQRDAERYLAFRSWIDGVRKLVDGIVDAPPLDLVHTESIGLWDLASRAFALRKRGKRELLELLRIPPMAAADWLGDWFESDLLQATLALPVLSATFAGPRSPGTAGALLLLEAGLGNGVVGNGPALIDALARAAKSHGAEIRTSAPVERILTGADGIEGVEIRGGERIGSEIVAASCSAKHALGSLLAAGSLPSTFEHRMRQFRVRGTVAQVLLAVDRELRFESRPDDEIALARTGNSLDELEQAFDAVKYGEHSPRPVLEIALPTVEQPALAPAHHAVVSILAHCAPYEPDGGWNEERRARFGQLVEATAERHLPELNGSVVGRRLLTPADLERRYALPGGQLYHGEHALDQLLVRPTPGCVGYRTPIRGLFLCGGGSHPGGGLTCAPGRLGARAILS